MKINPENYLSQIKHIDITSLPMPLQKGHEFLMKATSDATDWKTYNESTPVRKTIQLYFDRLNDYLEGNSKSVKSEEKKGTSKSQPEKITPKKPETLPVQKQEASDGKTSKSSRKKRIANEIPQPIMVERMPEELRFIKRFVNLNGKTKTKDEILRFVNSLQKAIVEKRIRKTSPYAEQVKYVQERLIDVYNTMKAKIKLELKPETYEEFKKLTGSEKVMASINFIKRYISMNGKIGMKERAKQMLTQINHALDRKKITDSDPYISEIHEIKKNLKYFTSMKAQKTLEIEKAELNGLQGILNENKFQMKLYDTFNKKLKAVKTKGNIITFKKTFYPRGTANQGYRQILVEEIGKDRGAIRIEGPFYNSDWYDNIGKLINAVDWDWMEEAHGMDGLNGNLGCACDQLNGADDTPAVMNSMDFADMEFDTLGFTGKWLELIGDPSTNFTAMVFGKPKMGKSYLCIDFAGYLARNHGKVLYVAKEEGLDYTLQQKLNDKDVAHPNLFVASVLPDSLAPYDFIFLDSVNKLGLTPEDLNRLKQVNPTKSFIFIFQSTKDGKFRGANTFQHDVDVVIEVPEKGKAVQMGRFNQGGTIDIFDHPMAA
jgi:hypothetical protein